MRRKQTRLEVFEFEKNSSQMRSRSEHQYYPRKIYIDEESLDYPLTERILKNLMNVPSEVVCRLKVKTLLEDLRNSTDAIGHGKKYLFLTVQKGKFVKPCPCTPFYTGCNYFVINLVLGCPLDCSYCILQYYLTEPWLTVHVNLEDLWPELDLFLKKRKRKFVRLGTGELGDSLALDHITENSKDLILYFRKKKNAYLELKTKTANIQNILKVKPAENIVISWSLNSPRTAREEDGAASFEERIAAARAVSQKGFAVGFHFDPLLRFPGWKEGYEEVIAKMLQAIPSSRISWISLGSLRFPPPLKNIIKTRFPQTKIIYDEFICGKDGKVRYFRPLRLELYQWIIECLRKKGGENIPLYFCMENAEIWKDALRWEPRGKHDVESMLSPRYVIKAKRPFPSSYQL